VSRVCQKEPSGGCSMGKTEGKSKRASLISVAGRAKDSNPEISKRTGSQGRETIAKKGKKGSTSEE